MNDETINNLASMGVRTTSVCYATIAPTRSD